ncbi:hypothetical protein S245_065670, partial [Arachis hypogaea]
GNTIQCTVKDIFVPIFEGLLAEGNVYVVTNFGVALNTIKFKSTRHEFRIHFKRDTIVRVMGVSNINYNLKLFINVEFSVAKDFFLQEVETEFGWWYKGCKKCRCGLKELEKRYFYSNCIKDYGFYVLRYIIHIRVIDHTDAASFVLFDGEAANFLGVSANDLRQCLVRFHRLLL